MAMNQKSIAMRVIYIAFVFPVFLFLPMTATGQAPTDTSKTPINDKKVLKFSPDHRPNLLRSAFILVGNTEGPAAIGFGINYERSIWRINDFWQLGVSALASTTGGDLFWSDYTEGPVYRLGPKIYLFNHERTFYAFDLQYVLYRAHEHIYTSGDPVIYNLHGFSWGVEIMVFKKRNRNRFWMVGLTRTLAFGPKVVEGDNGAWPDLSRYPDLNAFDFTIGCGRNF